MFEALTVASLVLGSAAYSIWRLLPQAAKDRLVQDLERRAPSLARRRAHRSLRRPPPPAARLGDCGDCSLHH